MSVEITRTCKYGSFTKRTDCYLLSGHVENVSIHLDAGSTNTGRTVRLKGGNVRVEYDGQKWVECNPGRKD